MDTAEIMRLMERCHAIIDSAPDAPWAAHQSSGYGNPNISNDDGPLASTGNARRRSLSQKMAFTRYVAFFDPNVLRALCDMLETVAGERDVLRDALKRQENGL